MLRRSDVAPGQTFAVDGDMHLRVAAVHSPWLEAGEARGRRAVAALRGARTASLLDAHGTTPVPPYLDRPDDDGDDDAYQTAYAPARRRRRAGLHFTDGHFAAVAAAFETHAVTLHVGAGTFRPVVGRVEDHAMHAERFAVSRARRRARAAAAALERPDARRSPADAASLLEATDATTFSASTSLCITPDGRWRFRAVDHLVTNFHHPDSTLLSPRAFAGRTGEDSTPTLAGATASLLRRRLLPVARGRPSKKVAASSRRRRRPLGGGVSSASPPRRPASARKKRVLLHSCCAPCSGAMIEEMVETLDADVTVFFYNPNIHPRSEYELKRERRYAAKLGIAFVDGDYDPDEWYRRARGLEYEPERGGRCTAMRGCSYSLRDNNFHRAKEGKPPIKPATADVYSDPRLDSEEESPDVVADFFERAPAFSRGPRHVPGAAPRPRGP
ncbi:queuosine biosynthesis protein [Aureococcus anophagefferens]|nr:queuosine biosynthesis protein [Aureococcus anophagefferens]